jgi:hypothetical protein
LEFEIRLTKIFPARYIEMRIFDKDKPAGSRACKRTLAPLAGHVVGAMIVTQLQFAILR